MAFIAGAFDATYDGDDIGDVENGFTVEWFQNGQLIVGDNLGRTPQDMVIQGIEVFVQFNLLEWNAAALKKVFWPFNATFGSGPTIGALMSTQVKQLVLTAKPGTSAAGLTAEDLWTFPNAGLAEGFPVQVILGPVLRQLPIRMRIYPDATNDFFTVA